MKVEAYRIYSPRHCLKKWRPNHTCSHSRRSLSLPQRVKNGIKSSDRCVKCSTLSSNTSVDLNDLHAWVKKNDWIDRQADKATVTYRSKMLRSLKQHLLSQAKKDFIIGRPEERGIKRSTIFKKTKQCWGHSWKTSGKRAHGFSRAHSYQHDLKWTNSQEKSPYR